VTTEETVGFFKGTIVVGNKEELAAYKEKKKQVIEDIANLFEEIRVKVAPEDAPVDFKLKMMATAKSRTTINMILKDLKINFDGLIPFL
jgi:Ca2+-dependent lipid-binding protein